MASIYESGPAKAGKEIGMYERTPENGDERDDKTRSAGLKTEDGRSSRGSNDGLASPMVVSPVRSQTGSKRGREGEVEAETEQKAWMNGASREAKGNADGSRKRQKVNEGTVENGCAPQQEQAPIPDRPMNAPHSEQPADVDVTIGEDGMVGGGLESPNLEEDGSEEGEVEA